MSDPRFEVLYIPEWGCTSHIHCYLIAVPSYLGDRLCSYLQSHKCKFQQRWSVNRYNRCEFFVEEIPPQVLERIVERTLANQGKVNLGVNLEVNLEVCPLTQEQMLSIKVNGQEVPASGDDMDDYQWWLSNDLGRKLKPLIEMAINSTEGDIAFYYDTRVNLNLRELLESYGFRYSPEEEAMRFCKS